ncbi:MAG: AAA family ATPase [Pseudanabaenaceae cyanobacterium]
MRVISLHLQNFRQHKKTELIFNSGVTGIVGANGAGKTTILEAIAWALYGNQGGKDSNAIRGNTDSLIWRMAPGKSSAVVKLNFAFGGEEYTISRMQSISKGQAELSHYDKVIANTSRTVNDTLNQILGMTQQEFFNSYFTGQKDLQFLGSIKGATDRERFIAKMLGYEHITTVQGAAGKEHTIRYDLHRQDLAVAELKGKQVDMDALQINSENLGKHLHDLKQNLQACQQQSHSFLHEMLRLEPQVENMTNAKNQKIALGGQLRVIEANHHHNQTNYNRLLSDQKKLIDLSNEFRQLQVELTNYQALNEEYIFQERAAKYDAKRQVLQTQLNDLILENARLLESQNQFGNLEDQWQIVLDNINTLTSEISHLESTIQNLVTQRQQERSNLQANLKTQEHLLANLTRQQATIESAGSHGNCPTCQRPLEDEYEGVLSNFERQKAHINAHIQEYQGQLQSFVIDDQLVTATKTKLHQTKQVLLVNQEQKSHLQNQRSNKEFIGKQLLNQQAKITKLQEEIATIPDEYNPERYNYLKQQLELLQPKYLRYSILECQVGKLENINAEIAILATTINQGTDEITNLKKQVSTILFDETIYQNLVEQLAKVRQDLIHLQQEEKTLLTSIGYAEAAYQSSLEAIDRAKEDAKALVAANQEFLLLKELDLSFSDLRQYLTTQIRPQLSQSASVFLNQLTQGRYDTLEIDDKYNILLIDHGQPKSVISGGEEDVVNLALRLAVSQMITERTGKPFSLLILDEIFGSLDDDRKDNVLGLLNALETQFEQIFLITHVDGIKDSLNNMIRLGFDPKEQCTKVIYAD